MRYNPHQLIEGMAIAGMYWCEGSATNLHPTARFLTCMKSFERALAEARAAATGATSCRTDFSFQAACTPRLRCLHLPVEETALLERWKAR